MTEYWVSKKQYWCKYCSIWIRDDAPSKKHHETGLKHIGNRERYIRDLYKTGNKAKADRAEEAAELAKIEALITQAALKSGDTATKLTLLESLRAQQAALRAGGHKARASAKGDAFANYTSAADLGFKDEETEKTSYEIEQELKGRAGEVGAWEEVSYEPQGAWSGADEDGTTGQEGSGRGSNSTRPSAGTTWGAGLGWGEKRKLGEYDIRDEEDHEDFDFIARSHAGPSTSTSAVANSGSSSSAPAKRKPRLDPYDQDDWDPRAAIKGKARLSTTGDLKPKEEHVQATNLDREAWGGKLELRPAGAEKGMMYVQGGGWVKGKGAEDGTVKTEHHGQDGKEEQSNGTGGITSDGAAPTSQKEPPVAVEPATATIKSEPGADTTTGMFKKRRPPRSSRKK